MLTLSNKKSRQCALAVILMSAVASSGCSSIQAGANHRPIIDGQMNAMYEEDLEKCQTYARQRSYLNGETQSDAVIGGSLGALSGAGGDAGSAVGGAILGAVIGGSLGALDTRAERKNIVINCMAQRGYKVLESQGQHN